MGLRIFMHSLRLVFTQLGDALRVSGVLYLIVVAVSALLGATTRHPSPPNIFLAILGALVTGLAYLWIAIGWHRFVLLDERPPTWVPQLPGDRLPAYLGRSIQLSFLAGVAGCAIWLPVMILFAVGFPPLITIVGGLGALTVLLLVSYRLAPMLPGAALGSALGVKEAWAATSGANGTILLLAVVTAIGSVLLGLPTYFMFISAAGPSPLSFVWGSIAGWINLMVGVSILTTLYGVYVQKRSIT